MTGVQTCALPILIISGGNTLAIGEHNRGNSLGPLILCLILAIWIGLRPVSFLFGDTVNYAMVYNAIEPGNLHDYRISSEWLWDIFTYLCRTAGLVLELVWTRIRELAAVA